MGKLADAIRDRRKRRPRRMGFGASAEAPQPALLVGAADAVVGADFGLALSDDAVAALSAGDGWWGVRLDALTTESLVSAKEAGASFVAFDVDSARADAVLDEDVDYVVRLSGDRLDEADARALATLRPAVIAADIGFPLSLRDALELRRLSLLTGTPLGAICPADVSSGDLEALRDSGVAAIVLAEGASADDVSAVRERVTKLPERKPRRDDDHQPILPTVAPSAEADED